MDCFASGKLFLWILTLYKYNGETSSFLDITVSIIQGSALGPASYVINTADLVATVPGNYCT